MTTKELLNILPKSVLLDACPNDCVSVKQISAHTGTTVAAVASKLKNATVVPFGKVADGSSKRPYNVFKADDVAAAYNAVPKKESKSAAKPPKVDGFGNPA